MLYGKQGLSLRGHRKTITQDGIKGNFLELVEFRTRTDTSLASHLKNTPKNAWYTSKNIQNDLISVLGDSVYWTKSRKLFFLFWQMKSSIAVTWNSSVATAILDRLNIWNIDIANFRWQGYDGALTCHLFVKVSKKETESISCILYPLSSSST